MGDHDEQSLLRRLLDCLQKPAGGSGVHLLGKIDNDSLPATLYRGKPHGLKDFLSLSVIDSRLFAFDSESGADLILKGIRIGDHQGTPIFKKQFSPQVLDFLSDLRAVRDRIDIVHIRMNQPADLMLVSHNLTQKRQDKSHSPAPVVLVKHHGMRNAPAFGHPFQRPDGIVIPYDSVQIHLSL